MKKKARALYMRGFVHRLIRETNEQLRTALGFGYHRVVKATLVGLLALTVNACTTSNPAATCDDGSCVDPAYP
jgi:hypothetical protein